MLGLLKRHRMPLLHDLMYGNQDFKHLHLIRLGRLPFHARPKRLAGLVVPCVQNTAANMFLLWGRFFDIGGFEDSFGEIVF